MTTRTTRGRKLALGLGVALALGTGVAAARTPAVAAPAAAPPIAIENFRFEPGELLVRKGSTVTWVNRDEELHAVVLADGGVSSPGLDTGGTWAHRFDAPGTYEYRCALHPYMKGTIVVR